MQHPRISEDIQPLSAFRAQSAAMLNRMRSTKRPVVLTQPGRSTAVILDVKEYEALLDELERLHQTGRT